MRERVEGIHYLDIFENGLIFTDHTKCQFRK